MAQNILETNQERKLQAARLRLLRNISKVHRNSAFLQRTSHHVPFVIDVEIFRAPSVDVIKSAGGLDSPVA